MSRAPIRCLVAALAWIALAGMDAHAETKLRFIMVTHGAASNPFWATIKAGAARAAADMGVELVYRAPDTFDPEKMAALVAAAIDEKPAGLIVSIPSGDALAAPMRAAVNAGIPVISINSGFDVSKSLGALLHVGQSEYEAGRVAGETMHGLGGAKALCLNHELGNVALDLRCKGFIDGFGGSVEVLPVDSDPTKVRTTLDATLAGDTKIDVILALSASISGEPAIAATQALGPARKLRVATFDMTEAVLAAVADQAASFAIDQQPFLQGYLPVQYLVLFNRYGVVPVSNVNTGPRIVDAAEAARRLGRGSNAPQAPAGTLRGG